MKSDTFRRAFLAIPAQQRADVDLVVDDALPPPHTLSPEALRAVSRHASDRLARALRHASDLVDLEAHPDVVCDAIDAAEAIARETLPWLRAARRPR